MRQTQKTGALTATEKVRVPFSLQLNFEGGKKEGDGLNFGLWIMARSGHVWRIVVSPSTHEERCNQNPSG